MTRPPPWRFGLGLIACVLWTCLLGIPLMTFHFAARDGLVDRFHATVLFLISNVLVFWLVARPQKAFEEVFVAEIVSDDEILTPFRQDEP